MSESTTQKSQRTEVVIACISLIGVLSAAFVSNWDKFFPRENQIKTEYSGYRPTGDFETEFRYFYEVSGVRKKIDSLQKEINEQVEHTTELKTENDHRNFQEYMSEIKTITPKLDDEIQLLLPVYQKYFTIEEIQELNRFYSTPQMRVFINKQPLVDKELAPVLVKQLTDLMLNINKIKEKYFPDPANALASALLGIMSNTGNKNENIRGNNKEEKQLGSEKTKHGIHNKIK